MRELTLDPVQAVSDERPLQQPLHRFGAVAMALPDTLVSADQLGQIQANHLPAAYLIALVESDGEAGTAILRIVRVQGLEVHPADRIPGSACICV